MHTHFWAYEIIYLISVRFKYNTYIGNIDEEITAKRGVKAVL